LEKETEKVHSADGVVGAEDRDKALPVQYRLKVENNRFTFSNLESLGITPGEIDEFTYAPQDTLLAVEYIESTNSLTVLDGKAEGNTYQWYYNYELLDGALNDTLESIEETGVFYCVVNNPVYPALELLSATYWTSHNTLQTDSLALVALYNATGGPNWTNNTNWLSASIGTWWGVTLQNNRVTRIDLKENNLIGTIGNYIGNLNKLKYLNIQGEFREENLSGIIPDSIVNLVELEYLNISDNNFSGNLPEKLWNLTKLQEFHSSRNYNITGTFPHGIEKLTELRSFFFHGPQLDGTFPEGILNCERLEYLVLNYGWNGPIPSDINRLSNLTYLSLSGNNINNVIPDEICDLHKLTYLELANTKLVGNLPINIGNLSNMTTLSIWGDPLEGEIPQSFWKMKKLTHLQLGQSNISGIVSDSINNLTNLRILTLVYMKLDEFPELRLNNLYSVNIANNKFDFEDIEYNIGIVDNFTYAPQDSINIAIDTLLIEGETLSYTLETGGNNNSYQWYKDGVALTGSNQATLEIASVQPEDAGNYYCEVTNSVVTDLILTSRIIHVDISTDTVPTNQQVSSTTLSSDDSDCFNATSTITVAGDGTQVIVESGAMAEFIAGQSILFRPGFHAQEGSNVSAYITTDGQYCVETTPAIVAQQQEEQGQQNEEKAAAVVTGTETAVEVPQTMLVYPNPNSGVFRVKFSQITEETQVMLFNSIGQMIFNQTTTDPEVLIDLPGITSGMYIVKAINRNNQFDQKVIVK
jgi:hypothetical protein